MDAEILWFYPPSVDKLALHFLSELGGPFGTGPAFLTPYDVFGLEMRTSKGKPLKRATASHRTRIVHSAPLCSTAELTQAFLSQCIYS